MDTEENHFYLIFDTVHTMYDSGRECMPRQEKDGGQYLTLQRHTRRYFLFQPILTGTYTCKLRNEII